MVVYVINYEVDYEGGSCAAVASSLDKAVAYCLDCGATPMDDTGLHFSVKQSYGVEYYSITTEAVL